MKKINWIEIFRLQRWKKKTQWKSFFFFSFFLRSRNLICLHCSGCLWTGCRLIEYEQNPQPKQREKNDIKCKCARRRRDTASFPARFTRDVLKVLSKSPSSRAVPAARNHLLIFRARVAVWEGEDTPDPAGTHTHTLKVAELPSKLSTSPLWPGGRV